MRSVPCALSLTLVLAASFISAQTPPKPDRTNPDRANQDKPKTQAEQDDFAGTVKSVSTTTAMHGHDLKWTQPGGPTMVIPVWCRDCSYDPDGTKTMSGQISEGKYFGDLIALQRDAEGHVVDRVVTGSTTEQIERHEIVGPFGKTEEYDYLEGKLNWHQIYAYDPYGHMSDALSFDSQGKQLSHAETRTTKDGEVTERSEWGKENELDWQQTADPETGLERFTTYDESGAVKLTWTFKDGKVLSFWERQEPDRKPQQQFGEGFVEDAGDGNRDNYQCSSDGHCDRSRVHYDYLDPAKKRNPTSVEWRDADGKLLYAAYYEYELDSAGNWTHRRISVSPTTQGDRALYEEDWRTITYWQQ